MGPSGGGKSYSALRLAAGFQRVQGGEVFVIDTEADRALQYADRFKFQHVPFVAPFGSLDYLAALQYCVSKGARTIIVDSMSHEHEGPGGMLDSAEQYLDDKAGHDWDKRKRLKMSSFIKPKADRQRLIQGMLQMHTNLILCFRAKEKIKPVRGGEPLILGWQPIAGDEFAYEMTARALLLPGANGVPEWSPAEVGERLMARRPEQFTSILRDGAQLSEDMGEAMARWAAGSVVSTPAAAPTVKPGDKSAALGALNEATTMQQVDAVAAGVTKRSWSDADMAELTAAIETKRNDLEKE
jgi:hypothetical protein